MTGPITVTPDHEAIPDALTERKQWICWRSEERDGELTKIPIDAEAGGHASTTDPTTWTDFDTAWSAYRDGDAKVDFDGIGYVFEASDPFVGVDLDGCRDPDGPAVDQWAREIVEQLDSYTEVSPSGTGIHVIVEASLPEGGNRSGDIEMYEDARYFTVTGEHAYGTPRSINERQDTLEVIHAEHIDAGDDDGRHLNSNSDSRNKSASGSGFAGDDEDLIETAKNAENGDKFEQLWNGSTAVYESHSEADLALCGMLAFYTGPDQARIDRLFRQSGLVRVKWTEREDYRERTIKKALADQTEFYEPSDDDGHGDGDEDLGPYEKAKKEREATTDPARALAAWDVLKDKVDVLAALPSGRIYAYRDGIWRDDGEQLLREEADALMGVDYSKNVLEEIVERVRSRRGVHIDDLGTPDKTIAVQNGLLDLERGGRFDGDDVRPLKPKDHALAQLPVEYDADADCPNWVSFIEESVEEDRHDTIQEYIGYCLLVGELPFARVLLLVGGGSNGKTTFLNVVTELLGTDNVTGFSLGDLVHSEYYVAEMHGAIANIDPDVTGSIGYAKKFKKLTGGDKKVSARRPYGEPFDYHPTTKQLYAANEVPDTELDDDAFYRRWLIIEFPTTFTDPDLPGPDKNPDLEVELLTELPGILNWALDGLDRLLQQGHFTNEGATEDKRRRWQSWGDSVEQFIEECITTVDPDSPDDEAKYRTGEVHQRYKAWCSQHGETAESQSTLTKNLKKIDGIRYSSTFRFDGKQARGFKGLAFTAETPPPIDEDEVPESEYGPLTQNQAVRRVRATVKQLVEESDGDAVEIDAVVNELNGDLGGRDPKHLIQNGLESGEFYEPQDGVIRDV